MQSEPHLVRLPESGTFPKVRLVEPTASGYLVAAFEIDHRPPVGFFIESAKKRAAIVRLKRLAEELRGRADVVEATVFKALLQPPGRGALLKDRPAVPIARFDLVLLVEARTPMAASALKDEKVLVDAIEDVKQSARNTLVVAATNERRIGPVDHSHGGVFLFNFFYADRLEQNLAVWEYTAGWFSDQTGLDNSTLLVPGAGEGSPYTVINHCRWDGLGDVVPSLLFKPSFRSYVLKHFEANDTAAMPILYRIA